MGVDEEVAVGARGKDPPAEIHSAVAYPALVGALHEAFVTASRPDPGTVDDLAIQAYLDEVGGPDLLEQQPVGMDEEPIRLTAYPRPDLLVGDVGHAVVVHDPIQGGQLDPRIPLLLGVAGGGLGGGRHGHGGSPPAW